MNERPRSSPRRRGSGRARARARSTRGSAARQLRRPDDDVGGARRRRPARSAAAPPPRRPGPPARPAQALDVLPAGRGRVAVERVRVAAPLHASARRGHREHHAAGLDEVLLLPRPLGAGEVAVAALGVHARPAPAPRRPAQRRGQRVGTDALARPRRARRTGRSAPQSGTSRTPPAAAAARTRSRDPAAAARALRSASRAPAPRRPRRAAGSDANPHTPSTSTRTPSPRLPSTRSSGARPGHRVEPQLLGLDEPHVGVARRRPLRPAPTAASSSGRPRPARPPAHPSGARRVPRSGPASAHRLRHPRPRRTPPSGARARSARTR